MNVADQADGTVAFLSKTSKKYCTGHNTNALACKVHQLYSRTLNPPFSETCSLSTLGRQC